MQGLWSRAAAAQSTCRCISCLSTTASGVTSRSATAASKRRLRIGNSITALYTSIFAGAALADAKIKDKRRHDWEEKIAAVKAEVNELMDEEKRILETLESRRQNRGLHRLLQGRGLGIIGIDSPATKRPGRTYSSTRSFHTERRLLNSVNDGAFESSSTKAKESVPPPEEEDLHFITDGEHLPAWIMGDPLRLKAVQKLALRQFAIRLMIRPFIVHRYTGMSMNYSVQTDLPWIDFPGLLAELGRLRTQIKKLKEDRDASYDDVIQDYIAVRQGKMKMGTENLDAELHRDLDLFMSQKMSVHEMLMRVSNNLLSSVDPDRTAAFRLMIMAFTKTRQNDLVQLLLRTMLPNHFYLSTFLILTILAFLRNTKDLKNFDLFLLMLSGQGYSANVGSFGRYRVQKVNGQDIVVPPLNTNPPVIYAVLISAALRFDQPDRADAYLQVARNTGFFDNKLTLFSYLRFYSIRQDWEKGIHAMKRAVTFMLSSTDLDPYGAGRLLVRMVHLCDSCSHSDAAEKLITAAVHSGFDPSLLLEQDDIELLVDPEHQRWSTAAETAPPENFGRPLWQKCYDFAQTFGDYLNQQEVPEDATVERKRVKMSGMHAQSVLSTALAGGPSDSEAQPTSDKQNQSTDPAQAEDITALKREVAHLRELVFELRKHHIENSFRDDNIDIEPSVTPPQLLHTKRRLKMPKSRSLSVEFSRVSSTDAPESLYGQQLGPDFEPRRRSPLGSIPTLGSVK